MSYDIVSLFMNTHIKEACDVIRKRLEHDKTLKKRINLTVENIMELLKFTRGLHALDSEEKFTGTSLV